MENNAEEKELVQRCLGGDEQAWSVLFHLHYEPLYAFLHRQSPWITSEQVEDLCQDTLSSVVRNLRQFAGRSSLKTWIFQIALHRYRDWVDQTQAAKRGSGKAPVSLNQENPETGLAPQVPDP
ncbi:MAG: hypothetical protein JO317_05435, partial [Verrucomicrobiae bacterium]|nr:hypothetical protein [Verrucomicrobiae bacterium]